VYWVDDLPVLEELANLRVLIARLRAENARLSRLLELTPEQAAPPGPAQTGLFDGQPGLVDHHSLPRGREPQTSCAHLAEESHVGLYPLRDGDMLAADFDGPTAMLEPLAYVKAARSWSVAPYWKYPQAVSAT
jgi:hypothetical protein